MTELAPRNRAVSPSPAGPQGPLGPAHLESPDAWELAGRRSLRDLAAGPAGALITSAFRVSPRQDRSMETVERLLAACEAIVRRTGRLDRLTVETVADEAGVTPQAAYRYFRDIRDLILLAVRRSQAAGHERLVAAITARTFDDWGDLAAVAVGFVIQNFQALARLPLAVRDPIARDYHDICYDQLWTLGETIGAAMAGRGDPRAGGDATQLGAALAAVTAVAKLLFLRDATLLEQPGTRRRLVGIFLGVLGPDSGQWAGFYEAVSKTDFFNVSPLD